MKIGSVGTSKITGMFLSAAKKAGGIEIAACYSRDPDTAEAFARKHGAEHAFWDLEAMAKSDAIDAVYIASPNSLHYEQSRLFLMNGKHVLCEKPMTTLKAQEEALIGLAQSRGLICTEAIMSIHTPAFAALKNAVEQIGRIRTVNLVFCQLSSKYPAYLAGKQPNIFNPAFHTGCLMDIGVYNIYLAAALFGKPDDVVSDAVFLDSGADAAGTAILKYGDMRVNLIYSKVGQSYAPSEIIGDEGTVSIGSVSQLTGIRLTKGGTTVLLAEDEKTRDEVMGAEAAFFRDTVENGRNEEYEFAERTSLLVREITDTIRRQNRFPF